MNHTEQIELPHVKKAGLHRRLYEWTLHWAHTPYGSIALFALAFSLPKKSFKYAAICSVGSVLGGCFGYFIGYQFFEHIGLPILNLYGVTDKFNYVKDTYNANAFAAVAIAGFTPIPYKVFTIAAGVCKINFWTFIIASAVSRSGRFFIVAGVFFPFVPQIKSFIDKYFNIISIAFVVILVGSFVLIKLFK